MRKLYPYVASIFTCMCLLLGFSACQPDGPTSEGLPSETTLPTYFTMGQYIPYTTTTTMPTTQTTLERPQYQLYGITTGLEGEVIGTTQNEQGELFYTTVFAYGPPDDYHRFSVDIPAAWSDRYLVIASEGKRLQTANYEAHSSLAFSFYEKTNYEYNKRGELFSIAFWTNSSDGEVAGQYLGQYGDAKAFFIGTTAVQYNIDIESYRTAYRDLKTYEQAFMDSFVGLA